MQKSCKIFLKAIGVVACVAIISQAGLIAFAVDSPIAPKLRPNRTIKSKDAISVTITQWGNSQQRLYKIGENGTWVSYANPFDVSENTIVYAKGIDSNGKSTPIATLKVDNIAQAPVNPQNPGKGTPTPNINDTTVGEAIYVSPTGTGEGTASDPASFEQALNLVQQGGIIYLTDGTYSYIYQITVPNANNGVDGKYKKIFAAPGAKPVIDFSSQPYGNPKSVSNPRGFQINGDYWYVKGIRFMGSADNGVFIGGNNNVIQECVTDSNRDSGLQLGREASTLSDIKDWPSYNLILNCTSYNNADPDNCEDADGFGCKLTTGPGNVFDGCISMYNADDGWDLFTYKENTPIGSVTIRNSIAAFNGITTTGVSTGNSDGNGFKMGGDNVAVDHYLENCIAYNNKNHGFTDNSNPGTIYVTNCTSFNNSSKDGKKSNFDFARQTTSHNVLSGLLSFNTRTIGSDKYRGIAKYSVLQNSGKYYKFTTQAVADTATTATKGTETTAPKASDFVSVTITDPRENVHTAWRNSDGTIKLGDFLKLSPTSAFATADENGTPLGASFN